MLLPPHREHKTFLQFQNLFLNSFLFLALNIIFIHMYEDAKMKPISLHANLRS